jgi:hypothetical protein
MAFYSILGFSTVLPDSDVSWTKEIPASMRRRSPRIWQMAAVSAARAISAANLSPRAIIIGTALGALDETKQFLDGIFTDGFGSPTHFIASVHNSMAGRIAQEIKIMGPNLTVCDGANSFASAVALCGVFSDEDFPTLVIAVDENIPLLDSLAPHLSPSCRSVFGSKNRDGSVAFFLDKTARLGAPKIRSAGVRHITDHNPDEAMKQHITHDNGNVTILMPSQTGGSFLSVPILVHDFLKNNNPGTAVYGSFSPSSNSIAVIEVCA